MAFIEACRQILLLGVILQWRGRQVLALPIEIENFEDFVRDAEKSLLEAGKALTFVQTQFDNWKDANNCKAFVESFVEPFQYCDARSSCITSKDVLLDSCKRGGPLTGAYMNLDVKPYRVPMEGNFSQVVATGSQDLHVAINVLCFDFGIVEELVWMEDGSVKSRLWQGYYKMRLGGCRGGIWSLLSRIWSLLSRLIHRFFGKKKGRKGEL